MTRYGENLRKLRVEKGLKQTDIAPLIGVSVSAVGMYEQGRRVPRLPVIKKTAEVLSVPVEMLYDPDAYPDVDSADRKAVPRNLKRVRHTSFDAIAGQNQADPAEGEVPESDTSADGGASLSRSEPMDEARSRLFDRDFTTKFAEIDSGGRTVVRAMLDAEHKRQRENLSAQKMEYRPINLMELPVSAGTGIALLPEDRPVPIYIPLDLTTRTADFVLEVQGDSMEPKFHDKDLILVRQTADIHPGEFGIFGVNGEGYFKKLEEGRLVSLNPKYSPVVFQEGDDVIFFGRVLGTTKRVYVND